MTVGIPFCDTPRQSLVVGLGAGLVGGGAGLAAGIDSTGVAVLAGGLALAGELVGHAVRGDAQFRAALDSVRRRFGSSGR